MVKLIANTPCGGLLPVTIGDITLAEVDLGPVTLIAPFKGAQKATSDALKASIGVSFPGVNRMVGTAKGSGARALWCGRGQALIMGTKSPDVPAAMVDHSDAWACVSVEGKAAADVLARLVPIDLRATSFKRGHTARTLIGHMTGSVTRTGVASFEVMVMRSMAGTLVHDLTRAAQGIAGRAALA